MSQRILIHAGKRAPSRRDLEAAARLGVEARDAPRGAIVASARIARLVTSPDELPPEQRAWWIGPIGWVLDRIEPVEPIPAPGRLGIWYYASS